MLEERLDTEKPISSDIIGIDLGQTLSKVVFYEDGQFIMKVGETKSSLEEIDDFLISNKDRFKSINFTGGKAFNLFKKYEKISDSVLINEFQANISGIDFLYHQTKRKSLPKSLIVTIGTGTSIVLKSENFEHLGGSALGGAFFMGMSNLLYGAIIYEDAIALAKRGNRYNVDLKVGEIYEKSDKRVDLLFREFTAASLGKVSSDSKKEDILSSIISAIGENLGTMATLMADNHDIIDIVFCGGFLIQNKSLKQILSLLCKVKNKRSVFIKNSEFAGAFGALTLKM